MSKVSFKEEKLESCNGNGTLRDSRPCDDSDILKIWNENIKNVLLWKYPVKVKKIDPVLYFVDKEPPFYALIVNFPLEIKRKLKIKYDFRIYYSRQIEKTYPDERLEATKNFLMHELLHAIPGCFNHGKTWKKYVLNINEKYGFRINPKPYSLREHPETF